MVTPPATLQKLREVLTDPATYPGGGGPVETRETHSSLVFLIGDQVFKLKKPVDLGFLDYSTPHRRAIMCRREVVLNRRLAPSVYLGVKRLVALPGGRWSVRDRGPAQDYLVHMRRLPEEATLGSRIAESADPSPLITRVARRLAAFHESAPQVPDRLGAPTTMSRYAKDNFREIAESDVLGDLAVGGSIREYSERFLRDNRHLFTVRAAAGRIRDGHGDLRCEHVYIEDDGTLSVIDCLEFSRAFRGGDVALDLAFLYMNLMATGYPDLAAQLVSEWQQSTGDRIEEILDFYTCYRAMVRAKVSHIRAQQAASAPAEREAALIDALSHLHLAARMAAGDRRPRLTLVAGLPATGKSTVARIAAALDGATLLVADQIRKTMAGTDGGALPPAKIDAGLYAPEMNRRVYAEMRRRARAALVKGRSVVLDATHRRRSDREQAAELAKRYGARLAAIECRVDEAIAHRRLLARAALGDTRSDADWRVYLAHREGFEPLTEISAQEHIEIDTGSSVDTIALLLLGRFTTDQPHSGGPR